jgi:hypothetical protein
MSVQATMSRLKGRLNDLAEEKIEERLEDLADYATRISPVDTGAYVTSFSIKRAGSGGGRSRSSENKPRNQNPETKRAEAYGQLVTDIQALNISDMIENGNVRITLRNRSPHARDVEDGSNWRSSGYHVFSRIRRKFG